MKRTLLTLSVLSAVVCCTFAFAYDSEGVMMKVATATPSAKITENSTGYGVSIGTVEAQMYSHSGLDLNYFVSDDYVSQTSEGTYMGFRLQERTINNEVTGEQERIQAAVLVTVSSTEESITVPDNIKIGETIYSVRNIGSSSTNMRNCMTSNIKSITVPSKVDVFYVNDNFNSYLESMYMLGASPSVNRNLTVPNVYICNKDNLAGYQNNSRFSNTTLLPYGWDFEWTTVNVGRKGEFAQTYIEMTDADWSVGVYVKVKGMLDSTDLSNIKNLTNLRKLDLSEAEFSELPNSFINGCSYLLEVFLPNSLASISNNAFRNCVRLIKVVAPGVEVIGQESFSYCSRLEELDLSKVSVIGKYAFSNCIRFNPPTFSSELKSIGSSAFASTALSKVVIPNGMESILSSVFNNCTQLTDVSLPSAIKSIGQSAFNGCTALKNINLPEGLTVIGNSAFYNCSSLEEITIPSTLQTIESSSFSGCKNLLSIKCKAIVPPVSNGSFTNGMDLNHCVLYIAPFAIDAYRESGNWKDFYIMKVLAEPVKNIYINRPMKFDLLSEDNAVLQNNPNMTLDYGVNSNTVGQLTAKGDGTLSAGTFSIFHRFNSRYNGSGYDYRTSLVNNAENMRADSVVCTVDLEKNKWHFISFQYDVKVADIKGLNNTDFVIREYDGNNRATGDGSVGNWKSVASDGILKAGKGYIIQAANNSVDSLYNTYAAVVQFPSRNTVTKNNLFTSNDIAVVLEEYPSEFAHNRSWNLIGNPYPCYYDLHSLKDDFTTPIILWRGTSYQAYSPVDDDIILRPNEAFFVQRPVDREQMTFGAEGRMHYDAARNAGFKPGIYYAPAYENSSNRTIFNFDIEGCGYDDRTRIVINEDASMDYEINRDASKFFAEVSEGVEIYVDGDIRYDICERPLESGVASLGVRVANGGLYTISLNGRNYDGWSVLLTDVKTGACVDLVEDAYEFEAEAGEDTGRFIIAFKTPEQNSIEEIVGSTDGSHVRVSTVSGMIVYEGALVDFMNSAFNGIYIVIDGKKSSKLVVK